MGWCRRLDLAAIAALALIAPGAAVAQPICSGGPWIDVRCYGAAGDGVGDDTAALRTAIGAAISSGRPLFLPHGTYRIGRPLIIDYEADAGVGFRLISMGATLDGRGIPSAPVLRILCSGGTRASPKGCFYFKEEGTLFVLADTDNYAVAIGTRNFADAQNSIKIDHLIVNNANRGARAGGLQLNYVLGSQIFAVADSAGGAAGIALEQVQISRLSGAGSASAPGGAALLIENGYSFADTIEAMDLEAAPVCFRIDSPRAAHNTFVSLYLACPIAVDATAGDATRLVNPLFAGNVRRKFAAAVGVVVMP